MRIIKSNVISDTMILHTFLLLLLINVTSAANILVAVMLDGKSHAESMVPFLEELANYGDNKYCSKTKLSIKYPICDMKH